MKNRAAVQRLRIALLAVILIVTALAAPKLIAGSTAWSGETIEIGLDSTGHLQISGAQAFARSSSQVPTTDMVLIPAGEFVMGCDESNDTCSGDDEKRYVDLDSFYIDKFEVTNARYRACYDAGVCTGPATFNSLPDSPSPVRVNYFTDSQYDNYPVIAVGWNQAVAFCTWEGKRLPTEAEWEKAARGEQDSRIYPWGDTAPTSDRANYKATGSSPPDIFDTNAVGSYPLGISPYGVMDMAGNVEEWVADYYAANYGEVCGEEITDPPCDNPTGPTSGSTRVIKAAGWPNNGTGLRIARRHQATEQPQPVGDLGFRCAADVLNLAPLADAGPNQSIHAGDLVSLDGTASTDDGGTENLSFAWTFSSVPVGSLATLVDETTNAPTFIADLPGDYVVNLLVTDAEGLSDDDEVIVSSNNAPPNADAGSDQSFYVNGLVTLDGSASNDPDLDPISYQWSLVTPPGGSAVLDDATVVAPSFVPDEIGTYEAQLIVNDGFTQSAPDQVVITVISGSSYSAMKTAEVINIIAGLPDDAFTTLGNKNAIQNWLHQAIKNIQKDKFDVAISKLEKAMERTDGCAHGGAPDSNDWIVTCTAQDQVYPLLKDARDALEVNYSVHAIRILDPLHSSMLFLPVLQR